ncbi:MAG TPA: hypothetical protein VM470_07580 [Acidimicrobiia bacterium]|nr:hypothetical protein [Acidimicrobiia bacterium]
MQEAALGGGRVPPKSPAGYRMAVDRFWDGLEMALDGLPPHLCRQGRLLRQNLGFRHSTTGTFRDILRGPHAHPVLHQHLWMLDDLAIKEGSRRSLIEDHAFRAALFTFALVETDDEAREGDGHVPFEAIRKWLLRQTSEEWAAVIPAGSEFWSHHRRSWEAYWEATLAMDDPDYGSTDAQLWAIQTARSRPLAQGPLAVAARESQSLDTGHLEALLDRLGFVESVRGDFACMTRHLPRGWVSPTVRRMASHLDYDLGALPVPELIVGGILIQRAHEPIVDSCLAYLQEAAEAADLLSLPTFRAYSQQLAATMAATRKTLLVPSRESVPRKNPAMGETGSSAQPTPLSMATGYLLADLTFKEAWEVHRWGLLGAAEVSARFPAGLILEILALHGHEVTNLIDDFFWSAEDRQFAYYDHPAAKPYIETDTLGLLLRLYKNSSQTERHRRIIEEFLALFQHHVRPDCPLPVWLVERDQASAVILGENCGTIEANLLRGLFEYQSHEHLTWIMPFVCRLLGDYAMRGSSVNVNYPHSYARAAVAELMERLEDNGLSAEVPSLGAARSRLRVELAHNAQQAHITSQEAACMIWTCSRAGLEDAYQDLWEKIVMGSQRFDGGWAAEPFFFAPTSGSRTMWHSSRLLTSALCLHALALASEVDLTAGAKQLPSRHRKPRPTP